MMLNTQAFNWEYNFNCKIDWCVVGSNPSTPTITRLLLIHRRGFIDQSVELKSGVHP